MGMGIELPIWVITTDSGNSFFNRKTRRFDKEVSESCLFNSPDDAEQQLRLFDFGYVMKYGRHYKDVKESRIRINR